MPMYEFKCQACGTDFEELVFSADEKVECPDCGSVKVGKKISVVSFKSSGKFTSSAGGGACSGCTPGPSGCSSCGGH